MCVRAMCQTVVHIIATLLWQLYISLSRLQACTKSHTVPSGVNIQATRPRARACIFHKTLGLLLYLLL